MSFLNKNYKYILILIVLLICFYRSPYIFLNGRFLAEDGSVWFSNAYSYGFLKGITQIYFGTQYFNLWANITSVIAILFPLKFAPLVTVYMAFLAQLYLYVFIIFGESNFLTNKLDKIIGVFIVIITPAMVPQVWLASNVSQVYFSITTILIYFQRENIKNFYYKFSPYLLLVSSLSSIIPCLLSPFFVLKYLKQKSKFNLINALLISIGTIFQFILFFYIKLSGLEALSDGPRYIVNFEKIFNFTYNVVVKSFLGRDLTQNIYFNFDYLQNNLILIALLIILAIIFLKASLVHIKKDKILKTLIFFFLLQSILVIYAAKFDQVQGRYAVIPSILLIFCVYRIFQISERNLRYFCSILITMSFLTGLYEYKTNTKYPELLMCMTHCPNWKSEIKQWEQDENYKLKIWQYPQKTMSLKKKQNNFQTAK